MGSSPLETANRPVMIEGDSPGRRLIDSAGAGFSGHGAVIF